MANLKNGTLNYYLTKDLNPDEYRERALRERNEMDPSYPDPNDLRFQTTPSVYTIENDSLYRDGELVGRIYNNKTGMLVTVKNVTDSTITVQDKDEKGNVKDVSLPVVAKLTGKDIIVEEGDDPFNGHEYVDLGLPSGTLWAKMNVGATSETDEGNNYQYGKGARTYNETYEESAYIGSENPLDLSLDTARLSYGGEWQMPTVEQLQELLGYTTTQYVMDFNNSGVGGLVCINKTDDSKYIFIKTDIWSSTSTSDPGYAMRLMITSYMQTITSDDYSNPARIRPVVTPKFSPANNKIVYYAAQQISDDTGYTMLPYAFSSTIVSHTFDYNVGVITFEDDLTYIQSGFTGGEGYGDYSGITKILLPESLTKLDGTRGGYGGVLIGTNIFHLDIPNNVTILDSGAIFGNLNLKTITIGTGIQEIKTQSIRDNTNLKIITILNPTPPTIEYSGDHTDLYSLKAVFVPKEAVAAYKGEGSDWEDLPIYPIPEYVDLGLPSGTKWATMNVGVASETEYGNYYMYGMGSETYDSVDTPYAGTENPLAPTADTAAQVWSNGWHMPTKEQLEELVANTIYEWTTIDGVNGGKFTAQNGNYIFIPAAGGYNDGSLYDVGEFGDIWSSTSNGSSSAYYLFFDEVYNDVSDSSRNYGGSVRPVLG